MLRFCCTKSTLSAGSATATASQCRNFRISRVPPMKPLRLPISKTKMYRVVEVPWQPLGNVEELLWRRQLYNTALKTLREFFRAETSQSEELDSKYNEHEHAARQEFSEALNRNNDVNKKLAEARERAESESLVRYEANARQEVDEFVSAHQNKAQQNRRAVLDAVAESSEFVTPENVMEKINAALDNPIDHNYVLDVEGRVYAGNRYRKYYDSTPVDLKEEIETESAPLELRGQLTPLPAPDGITARPHESEKPVQLKKYLDPSRVIHHGVQREELDYKGFSYRIRDAVDDGAAGKIQDSS